LTKTSITPFDIPAVEKKYGATFVGDFPTKTTTGWGYAGAVFYQPNPDVDKGHSHLFGLATFVDDSTIIYNASYLDGHKFYGVRDGDTYLWSRYVHDFREVPGGFLDGGFDYFRRVGNPKNEVTLMIKDGVVVEVDD